MRVPKTARFNPPRAGLYSTIRSNETAWEKSNRNYSGDNVNLTKISPCFGCDNVAQNVDIRSSKYSRLQQNIEVAVRDLTAIPLRPTFGFATHRLGTTVVKYQAQGKGVTPNTPCVRPWCHGSLNSVATRPSGNCQFCNPACSNNCGALNISWKICC